MIQTTTNGQNLILIQNKEELPQILDGENHKSLSINVETTGFDYNSDNIVGISIGAERKDGSIDSYYIPIRYQNYNNNIDEKLIFDFVDNILKNERVLLYGREFIFFFLEKEGVECDLRKTHDVQIMLYLATSKPCPAKNDYARMFLPNFEIFELDLSQQNFASYKPEVSYVIAAQKVMINIMLAKYVWDNYPMIHSIYTLDNKSNEVIRWFSKNTLMPINKEMVKKEYELVNENIENIKYQCKSVLGYDINIDNPNERLETLKKFLPITADIDTFKDYQLADFNHPIAKLFKEYSEKSAYKNTLEKLLDHDKLRIHYSTISAQTGRLSSGFVKNNTYFSDFNIQNVEKKEVIRYVHKGGDIGFYIDDNSENSIKEVKCKGGLRDAFICPGDDYVWVSCDYSGEEMCLLANFSKEENLIKPIQEGKDIHNYIAKSIFGYENPECRTKTKALNFSVVYGAGEYSIAKRLGVSTEECKKLLEKYYSLLKNVEIWRHKMIAKAREKGYVSTLFGRPRMLYSAYQSNNKSDHYAADRAACNSPIQGCTPLSGHLETENAAIRMNKCLGRDSVGYDKRNIIATRRSEGEPLFCYFKSGDYMICDNNHQLIYNNIIVPKTTSIRTGFKNAKVLLSPLHKKKLPIGNFLFKNISDCKALFVMTCKRKDVIENTDKDINCALFRLALSGRWFNADYDAAVSMRSVASIFGYNVVYNSKKDLFKVKFFRKKKTKIKNIWWCFTDDRKVPMGTCTAKSGYQMYANQGFWNKNTGADIIRIVLCKFKNLFDSDKEWAENVKFACTIHDECNFYVKKSYLNKGIKKIYDTMYFEHPLCVLPIKGNISVGSDWGHLLEVKLENIGDDNKINI